MSIGPGELLVRVGAPIAVAALFSAVILAAAVGPERDLQLLSPEGAVPGRPVALRALLLEDLERPEGPAAVQRPVAVRLEGASGAVLARARLTPSAVGGMEGGLAVPAEARGERRLWAEVRVGGERAAVHAPLQVGPEAPTVPTRGRLASPLQQYLPFDVRPVGEAAAPAPLEARVVGGACVPEVPCRLVVWVGTPAAAVRVDPTRAVEPRGPAGEETSGLVSLEVVVHGPEADLHLEAIRGGAPVARRTVRLPIAQAAPAVRLGAPVLRAPAQPQLHVETPEPGTPLIVDAFREGHWERTGSAVVADDGTLALPFASLGPGVWRLQIRPDALSVETAATRLLVVLDEGVSGEEAPKRLARRSVERGLDDPWARRVLAGELEASDSVRTQVSFLAALHELELVPRPAARSSYIQATVGAAGATDRWRLGAAGMVFVLGLAMAAYLVWRGRRASREARGILAEGDAASEGEAVESAVSERWAPVGVALLVIVIFASIALFMLSR